MKRVIGLLLACILAAALTPSLAEEAAFVFDSGRGIITAYTGTAEKVSVPGAINGVPVRAIGENAFGQNTTLREVVLPEGLTHILASAFYFCENLESVVFPRSLQAIDAYAFFANKKLGAVHLSGSVAYIGERAFASCEGLLDVRLLGAHTVIDKTAFELGPEDRKIAVPPGALAAYEPVLGLSLVPGEEEQAVYGQAGFETDEQGRITGYTGFDAYLSIPESISGKPVTEIAQRAFYTEPWLRVLVLPEGLQSIGMEAFFATRLADVRFPGTLTSIGDSAFSGAPLMALSLPDGLTQLGSGAFAAAKMTRLELPHGLKEVPEKAFERCWMLETLVIPAGIETIGSKAFLDCDKMNYLVFEAAQAPDMAADAFLECDAIVDIDIAHDASREQALAFDAAFRLTGTSGSFKVWRAYHPNAPAFAPNLGMQFDEATQLVTAYTDQQDRVSMFFSFWKKDGSGTLDILGVGEGAFEGTGIREFYVPRSDVFTTIAARAFKNSSLEFIDLFDSVTTIGEEAFMGCAGLREIRIPDSVQTIGANAFAGCDSLQEVVLPAGVQLAGNLGLPAGKIKVAAGASDEQIAALRAAMGYTWDMELLRVGERSAFTPLPEGLAFSPEGEFEFDAATGTITRYKGQSATVIVPRSIQGVPVSGIGFSAFSNLTVVSVALGTQDNVNLQSVILPDTVRRIEDSAFLNCATLTLVEVYGPIDRLGIRAFENCKALKEVHFYNGIQEIGIYAFNLCESLSRVGFGPANPAIPEGAFVGCGFEGTLVISAPAVGNLAYQNNAKVTSLHILPGVKEIGDAAFAGITGLNEVYMERSDAEFLGSYRYQFDQAATGMKVYIPESAGDAELALFVTKMNQNMLPGENMVSRKNCPTGHEAPPRGDTAALEPGVAQEAAAEPETTQEAVAAEPGAAQEVAATTEAPPAGQEAATTGAPLGKYLCVSATSGGIALDLAVIGVYSVEFLEDRTAVLTLSGTALPPMAMTMAEGSITLDYYGQQYLFKALPDGGYEMDFMGAMMLTFQKE